MRGTNGAYRLLLAGLGVTTAVMIVLSTGLGYMDITTADIVRCVGDRLFGWGIADTVSRTASFVVLDVRLPRILTAVAVGGGLAMSGVIYQGILLNPLADPYTLGVSSGAALGASLALLANLAALGQVSVPCCAFVGAVGALAVVLYLSSFHGRVFADTLILSGVIVGTILAAGISFIKYLADEQVSVIVFWLMGSFAARTWTDVALVSAVLFVGTAVGLYYGRDLNIMSLGERSADSLGVETGRTRLILLLSASLVTAICVAVSGIIGFIGLIVPHLMRLVVGPDSRKLIPVSVLGGGCLLLFADTVTRAVLPAEVPIGVLTALIGGPVFCVIFRTRQRWAAHDSRL